MKSALSPAWDMAARVFCDLSAISKALCLKVWIEWAFGQRWYLAKANHPHSQQIEINRKHITMQKASELQTRDFGNCETEIEHR